MSDLLALALAFIRVSLGAFGGGLTTLPLIHHELVIRGGWLTNETFAQLISVAQMTPGPVALNAATFAGYRVAGLPGALVATSAVLMPPLMIMALFIVFARKVTGKSKSALQRTLVLLAPGVAALLFLAFLKLARPILPHPELLAITGLSVACLRLPLFRNRPPLLFLLGGLLALGFYLGQ